MGEGQRGESRAWVRITRAFPAPLMDGYDVHALRVGRIYQVDEQMARYLVLAGYALRVDVEQRADD